MSHATTRVIEGTARLISCCTVSTSDALNKFARIVQGEARTSRNVLLGFDSATAEHVSHVNPRETRNPHAEILSQECKALRMGLKLEHVSHVCPCHVKPRKAHAERLLDVYEQQ